MTRATTTALQVKHLFEEAGLLVRVVIRSDALAATQNAHERRPGWARRAMVTAAFVKDAIRGRLLAAQKVGSHDNMAPRGFGRLGEAEAHAESG
eukprot:15451644-Alexandrium_andersonii.AAC.1